MILRLKSDAVHKATESGDLIPEDYEEVLQAATDLASMTVQITDTILNDKKRLKKADLGYFVGVQLGQEQKLAATFAKAMLDISPSFGKEVHEVLNGTIVGAYQDAIDELKKKHLA